jgi:hypothetical protein
MPVPGAAEVVLLDAEPPASTSPAMMSSVETVSRFPVGSSARINAAWVTIVRATAGLAARRWFRRCPS